MKSGLAVITVATLLGTTIPSAFAATQAATIVSPVASTTTGVSGMAEPVPTASVIASGPIAPGDTLWKIAKSNDIPLSILESFNPSLNPNDLLVGEVVNVPRTWTVTQGNTLFQLAHTFGVSVESIAQLNNLSNSDVIYPGQILLVPAQTSTNTTSVYQPWTVRSGDTLWKIAQVTGASVPQISDINNVTADNLPLGRVLLIPPTSTQWTEPPEQVTAPVSQPQTTTQSPSVAKIVATMPTTTLVENSNQDYEVDVTALDTNGNPVPNVTLDVVGSAWANTTQVVTDPQGKAQFTIQAGNQTGNLSVEVQDPSSNVSCVANYKVVSGN